MGGESGFGAGGVAAYVAATTTGDDVHFDAIPEAEELRVIPAADDWVAAAVAAAVAANDAAEKRRFVPDDFGGFEVPVPVACSKTTRREDPAGGGSEAEATAKEEADPLSPRSNAVVDDVGTTAEKDGHSGDDEATKAKTGAKYDAAAGGPALVSPGRSRPTNGGRSSQSSDASADGGGEEEDAAALLSPRASGDSGGSGPVLLASPGWSDSDGGGVDGPTTPGAATAEGERTAPLSPHVSTIVVGKKKDSGSDRVTMTGVKYDFRDDFAQHEAELQSPSVVSFVEEDRNDVEHSLQREVTWAQDWFPRWKCETERTTRENASLNRDLEASVRERQNLESRFREAIDDVKHRAQDANARAMRAERHRSNRLELEGKDESDQLKRRSVDIETRMKGLEDKLEEARGKVASSLAAASTASTELGTARARHVRELSRAVSAVEERFRVEMDGLVRAREGGFEKDRAERDAIVETLRVEVGASRAEVECARSELGAARDELESVQGELTSVKDALTVESGKVRAATSRRAEEVVELERRVDEARVEVERERRSRLETEIRLGVDGARQTEEQYDLKLELDRRGEEARRLERKVEERDAHIIEEHGRAEERLDEMQRRVDETSKEREEAEKMVLREAGQVQAEVSRRAEEVVELKKRLDDARVEVEKERLSRRAAETKLGDHDGRQTEEQYDLKIELHHMEEEARRLSRMVVERDARIAEEHGRAQERLDEMRRLINETAREREEAREELRIMRRDAVARDAADKERLRKNEGDARELIRSMREKVESSAPAFDVLARCPQSRGDQGTRTNAETEVQADGKDGGAGLDGWMFRDIGAKSDEESGDVDGDDDQNDNAAAMKRLEDRLLASMEYRQSKLSALKTKLPLLRSQGGRHY